VAAQELNRKFVMPGWKRLRLPSTIALLAAIGVTPPVAAHETIFIGGSGRPEVEVNLDALSPRSSLLAPGTIQLRPPGTPRPRTTAATGVRPSSPTSPPAAERPATAPRTALPAPPPPAPTPRLETERPPSPPTPRPPRIAAETGPVAALPPPAASPRPPTALAPSEQRPALAPPALPPSTSAAPPPPTSVPPLPPAPRTQASPPPARVERAPMPPAPPATPLPRAEAPVPRPQPAAPPAAAEPSRTQTAAVAPPRLTTGEGGRLARFTFAPGVTQLGADGQQQLRTLVSRMLDTNDRVQLVAHATGPADRPSDARRTSLSRALAVRAFMIEEGIRSTRIDVRALGSPEDTPADRVDVILLTQ
jgi:outer membrane protein OmpA-like peptidoglycan-associated protein